MLSIITICKNSAGTIKETIDSVVKQSFVDWELVVKDGGSIDATLDIVETYKDSRIRVFSSPDTGISDAFNQAIQPTSGDFILFLNSDDRFASDDALEKFIAQLGGLSGLNAESGVYYAKAEIRGHKMQLLSGWRLIMPNGFAINSSSTSSRYNHAPLADLIPILRALPSPRFTSSR